ncbi:MAG: hypothetical protein IJ163_02435 [Bacteroidaceae bacterium]|nr:hypothetical protein [Bacteroidaceae bacterium]
MSKNIFMALALSAMFMTANAQEQQGFQNQQRQKPTITPEQRAERSAARIAGQLMLNDADAEKFKGVYKNYQLELSEANQKFKKEPKKMEQGEKPQRKQRTEQEIEQDIKNRFARQRAVLDVEEKYYDEFRSVLNPRQIEKVYQMSGKGMKNAAKARKGFGKGKKGFGKGMKGKGMKGKGKMGKGKMGKGMRPQGQGKNGERPDFRMGKPSGKNAQQNVDKNQ